MMANRARARLFFGAVSFGLVAVALASCSDGDTKKHPFGVGGSEAGAANEAGAGGAGETGGAPSAGASGLAGETGAGGDLTATGPGGASNRELAGAGGMGGEAGAACDSALTGSRIVIAFDPDNAERVTNLQWVDSASAATPNLIAQGGPAYCNDPIEFFGQSYGAPEGTLPDPVVAGYLATLVQCGLDATITSAAESCNPAATPQMPVTTRYHFYDDARASEIRITRTLGFDAATPVYADTGVRPFVPRVPITNLGTVIFPNQASTAVTVTAATNCGGDCIVPTGASWNGQWFADINATSGLALIVLRDPTLTSPVSLTVNNDSNSVSNLTSFVVLQPTNGWKAPITEIEYLCFADLTSWPQAERDAAQLPPDCGP